VYTITKTKLFENARQTRETAWRFRVDGEHFENVTFRKQRGHDHQLISLTEFSSNTTNPKSPVIVAFLNFSDLL